MAIISAVLQTTAAFAQRVTYAEDFQTLAGKGDVSGWIDSGIAGLAIGRVYKTWTDPLDSNNVVYGFRQMRRRAVGAREPASARYGTFSTFTQQAFTASGPFEYRGRFLRTNGDARIGLTFFSSYPEADRYDLIGLCEGPSMRWVAQQPHAIAGNADSSFIPEPNRWVRFLIQAEQSGGSTTIRARFWYDGSPEPSTFSIDVADAAPGRSTAGRIGIWSAGGDVFVDDLLASSSELSVKFIDLATNRTLDPFSLASFKTAARIEIEAAGAYVAKLDGRDFTSGTAITDEGFHSLTVSTAAGETTLRMLIDTTPPVVSLRVDGVPFSDGQSFDHEVTLSATVSDVSQVTITSTLDGATVVLPVTVSEEKAHQVTIRAVDQVGWEGVAAGTFAINRPRAGLVLLTPSANLCTNHNEIEVTGLVTGAHAPSVKMTLGSFAPVVVAVAGDGAFAAKIPAPSEGKYDLVVEAAGASGKAAVARVSVTVDRSRPAVQITSGGSPFAGGSFNRPLSLFVAATDIDSAAQIDSRLNDVPFVSGTPITAEGTYVLRVTATDCAGNVSDPKVVQFTIDLAAPRIVELDPADGSALTTNRPAIRGAVDSDDLQSVTIDGLGAASISGRSFTFNALALAEGTNRLALVATDRAGNTTRIAYTLRVKTIVPALTIVENGSPIQDNAIFNRPVTPIIRANEPTATISATLNGTPFTSGTMISEDGSYSLTATASDATAHASGTAGTTFSIDRKPPSIAIIAPVQGTIVSGDRVDVHVNATGADTVAVNGVAATAAGSEFVTTVALDRGTNLIIAIASDRAGNHAADQVEITRADSPAIVLTLPAEDSLTNRTVTTVAGQVLTPPASARVLLNGKEIAIDDAGAFRVDDFALNEGLNAITATLAGSSAQVTTHVTADFTPPRLTVLANRVELHDGDRFAAPPSITIDASDDRPGITSVVTLDGTVGEDALLHLADGGHALTVIARDAAGNETRADRSFVIGGGGSTACAISNFDPPDGSAVFADRVKLAGRAAGATGVVINGTQASIDDGSFAAQVALTREGANAIEISCADSSGAALSSGTATLTLFRVTGAPSITIESPPRNTTAAADSVAVSGSVSRDVTSGDVNGVPFTPAGGKYSLPSLPLSTGANIIVARARNAAGRVALATTYVIHTAPPQISITSPLPQMQTSTGSIDVSGTYRNVDPSTLSIAGSAVTAHPVSDTTGTYIAPAVPLPSGPTTMTVVGRSAAGESTSASVVVQANRDLPSIRIEAPPDNSYLPPAQDSVVISGSVSASPGSVAQVNGAQTPIDAANHFSSTVAVSTTGLTPAIARVTTREGSVASDNVGLIRLGPLVVKETFPASGAGEVDPGVLLLVLLSNPIDAASARAAVTLADSNNQALGTAIFVDDDAVSVAPNIPLLPGMSYTLTISAALKDAAGSTLPLPFALTFATASSAPVVAPILDQSDGTGCLELATITGAVTVAGARVRLDVDGISSTVSAGGDRRFRFDFTFSGQAGYHIARVREVGADGTLSPESTVVYRISCDGPLVVTAALDRLSKKLVVQFSKPVDAATLIAAPDGTIVLGSFSGSVSVDSSGETATVAYTSDLGTSPLTLTLTRGVKDSSGIPMATEYRQTFAIESNERPAGKGSISGAVYDAATGRPLPNALITAGAITISTDDRGRYVVAAAEGAYAIEANGAQFATAWRQVIVRAGAATVPLDFRLSKRGAEQTMADVALELTDGGDTSVTSLARLSVPVTALPPGKRVALTSLGGQSVAAPLPLGWSPIAAAEIAVERSAIAVPIPGSRIAFALTSSDSAAIVDASQVLTLVQYDGTLGEWRIAIPVVPIAPDGTASIELSSSGDYALVYPDQAASLSQQPLPHTAATLQGVADPCGATPEICRPAARSFALEPAAVAPNGRTIARLIADGNKAYPSGTAVQATIDEQLNLANGQTLIDPPFTTDLLLYRSPAGDTATALFHLAPSAQATAATLRDGVDHIVIVDHPGRIERGALIGAEGGRVSGGDNLSMDIPTGATLEPIHSAIVPISDLSAFGSIPGFHIVGGFTISFSRADGSSTPVSLLKPARLTLTVPTAQQVIIAELLNESPFGSVVRLTTTASVHEAMVFISDPIDPAKLPLDGLVHGGTYLILSADAPIAFAFGQVRLGSGGPLIPNALVLSDGLGVADITRIGGRFSLPVPAKPATPFALRARSLATGEGSPSTYSVAPDLGAIESFGDLILSAQPPHLLSLIPANGSVLDPGTPFQPQATFDAVLDSSTAASAIVVNTLSTGAAVAGSADSAGGVLTFHPAEALQPSTEYSVTVLPALRGMNGAPFGRTAISRFSTRAVPANGAINADRIRITIPDANGVSTIIGRPGALPAGSQAVAVRRRRSFGEQYQSTAAADGSFNFSAGQTKDAITTRDAIDLLVVDGISHATIAVIPLTPFTTSDGKGFLAPPDAGVQFATAGGFKVSVPAGAFDGPTLITIGTSSPEAFAAVPSFAHDLAYSASIDIQFDGLAKKRLDVELPAPPNSGTRPFYLGYVGQSIRGPRVMIVNALRIESGRFTTILQPGVSSAALKSAAISNRPASLSSAADVNEELLGVMMPGTYAAVNFVSSTAWALFNGVREGVDLFWDSMPSLYASSVYVSEGHGRVVVPVAADRPFNVVGDDAATGLEAFRRLYDPLAAGEPANAVPLPSPIDNEVGPVPVFASPARIEAVDLPASGVTLESVRNLVMNLENGILRVTASESPLPAGSRLEVLDTSTGALQVDDNFVVGHAIAMPASVGDRILLLISEQNVDPDSEISIVFNKPIYVSGEIDQFIHSNGLLKVLLRAPHSNAPFAEITNQVRFAADSGNRRITIRFDSSLHLGMQYRLVIGRQIGDTAGVDGISDLRLAQRRVNGTAGPQLSDDLHVDFTTREPGGNVAGFDLASGTVRDLALEGNIGLISALDGGVQAIDVSDPATPRPLGSIAPGVTEFWAVVADHHGRVYTTGLTSMFGVLRTYRLDDFVAGINPAQRASATLSWRPGINTNVPLGTEISLSDRPEATPRKLQIALQDDAPLELNAAALIRAFDGSSSDLGSGFQRIAITVRGDRTIPYQTQRVTIENRTLELRWSVDVPRTGSASLASIIARPDDELFVIRNRATYGVVSLFGYGLSVFDLNAVESNELAAAEPNGRALQEQVALSKGADPTPMPPCDAAQSAATGAPCPIRDLAFSPEALIRSTSTSALKIFALDANRGVLDLNVAPPSVAAPAGGGLTLASAFIDQPRLHTLRDLYRTASGSKPFAHFTSIAAYKNYALIAANQFGLLVIRLDGGALDWDSLVDVVWVPAGAYSARVMGESDMAVVIDGAGRVLLVDLKRIDESSQVAAIPACTTAECSAELFPTSRKSITSSPAAPSNADWIEVGADDPRIIWKSAPHLVRGTLAPIVDPGTGFVFTGDVNTAHVSVVAALDPRLHVVINTGAGGFGESGGVVPLGIDPPANVVSGPDGSLAAFRLETILPAAMNPRFAVESETVAGSTSVQTQPSFPLSHLRGAQAVSLTSVLPATILNEFPALRMQRGASRFVSPWIIALADPRAAKQYVWPSGANKRAAGCFPCDRPAFLQNDFGAIEIYSNGRFLFIHPDQGTFTGSYAYLNGAGRLTARLSTIPADTIRPTNVLSAAQDAPFARGALQSSVLLHSGELVESAIDLDAGGRAGWNVVFDRTYRSRTIGGCPVGLGWESSIFRRLRALPNGNVEYRDATGEEWLFRREGAEFLSPSGLYLRLAKMQSGWTLVDQKQRITTFDSLGRLTSESDVFFDGHGGGNIIHYVYDSTGRLTSIVDPMGRVSTLRYDSGRLHGVTDWRGRTIDYHFDAQGRLVSVDLPRTKNSAYLEFDHASDSTRPTIAYGYAQAANGGFNAMLEIAANLRMIQEPGDTVARVTFDYFDSGNQYDMLRGETWGTNDNARATFEYTVTSPFRAATAAVVSDAFRQQRMYSIGDLQPTDSISDRAHIDRIVETAIPIWAAAPFGSLPDAVLPETTDSIDVDRTIAFGHGVDGRLETVNKSATPGPISFTTCSYDPAGTVGVVMRSRSVTPAVAGMTGLVQNFGHSGAFLTSTESDGERIDTPEPRRGALDIVETDGGVSSQKTFDTDGVLKEWHTLEPVAPAVGAGEKGSSEYYPADDPVLYRRGLLRSITVGEDVITTISYPDADTEVRDAPRGVQTRTEYDELRRPVHIVMTGPGAIWPEEWFAYDAKGRLVRHKTRRGDRQPEKRTDYDILGRLTKTALYDGFAEIESTQVEYLFPDRIERTTLPAGGVITSTMDGLGRTIDRATDPLHPFATIIAEHIRYDVDDNVVFSTDGRNASATRYDAAHRAVESIRSDLSRTTAKIDGWGRLRESKDLGTGARFTADYTPGGKLKSMATNTSREEYGWDAAGRRRSIVTRRGSNEAIAQARSEFDSAGRLVMQERGESDGTNITRIASQTTYSYNGLDVPSTIATYESDVANRSTWNVEHDLLGNTTRMQNGTTAGFSAAYAFDEAGSVTSSRTPSRPGTFTYQRDARGLTTAETLPNAAAPNRYAYDPGGAIRQYLDPEGEETRVTNDGLGRPVLRSYPDGSSEEIHYQGDQVIQIRDRQGRFLNFTYNIHGQLEQIHNGGELLDELTYDSAGRLTGWKSEGTKIEYDDFDLDGRPQTTRQIRHRMDGSEIDRWVQRHTYNGAGERTSWSMPGATGAWTSTVFEEHDAMGNVIAIRRTAEGASPVLMTAEFRNAERPASRRVTLGAGPADLIREYAYDDRETGIGRLSEMKVFSAGSLIAGSHIGYNGLLRTSEQLFGVAGGERSTVWNYDDRGRLTAMPSAGVATSVYTTLTDADFQTSLSRSDSSATFAAQAGHKIATVTRGEQRESIRYEKADGTDGGSQRTEDARFRYEFDERGRLRKVTEKFAGQARLTRVLYSYTAMDRMVGRRVETASITNGQPPRGSDWILSSEPTSLPPSITFVWDPVSDQLIEMADAENGRLLRQFIHGGMGYDDPIEIFDGIHRYYPILDEAGTGSLQAVIDEEGKLVNRTIIADPYGEEAEALNGPAVDRITVSGSPSEVKIAMHVTEPIDPSTVAGGVRMTPSSATPSLTDPYTITWTMGALPTANLLVEVTSTLRSTTFGPSAPVLFSGYSVSSAEISQRAAAGSSFTFTPFNATALTALATRPASDLSATLVMSPFKAHPFTDPLTGLDYVRARWLDRRTSTFLSPDPVGYRDSANLYAYCAGDPVNCSDPTGASIEEHLRNLRLLVTAFVKIGYAAQANELYGDKQAEIVQNVAPGPAAAGWGIYVNGVKTPKERAVAAGRKLAATDNLNVDVVWNPSTPGLLTDFYQAGLVNKANVPDVTTSDLIELIRRRLSLLPRGQTLRLYGHSQAGAIISSATSFLTPAERSRIDLITLAGSAYKYPTGFHSEQHWVNRTDAVPVLFGRGLAVYDKDVRYVNIGLFTHDVFQYIDARSQLMKNEFSDR